MTVKKISCCKDCIPPKRHPGCHSTCEEYQKERKELDEYNKQQRIDKLKVGNLIGYDVERHDRVRKKKQYK